MNSRTQSGKLSVRDLCALAILAALMFAFKVALSSLPNINLNALIIILTTVFYGWATLYTVAVYILLEGLIYGFSVWWISYFLVWPSLVIVVMLFRHNNSTVIWAIIAGAFGLLFGPMMYVCYFTVTGGWNGFLPMWIAGIPYDLLHAVSNFLTVLLLFKPLSRVMKRYVKR